MIFNLFLFFSSLIFSLNSASSSKYDEFGLTKLHNLILSDQFTNVKSLVKSEIEGSRSLIDLPDLATSSTALHLLVEKVATQKNPKQVELIVSIIEELVKAGVDRTIQTDSGWTALNKAVYLASDLPDYPVAVIEDLLKDCVAVDRLTDNKTVLHFAAASRLKPDRATVLVNLLLKQCAAKIDFDALDANNWTALKTAIAADNTNVIALLKPKTSSISFVMKIVLAALALLLISLAAGLYYYFKFVAKKPTTTENKENNVDNAETETETGSKEKIN